MKRIDRVYQYVKSETENLNSSEIDNFVGVTTNQVAENCNIQRSNASKDLNSLVREGLIDKLDGRPVRYVCKSVFRHKPLSKYVESYLETEPNVKPPKKVETFTSEDIFKRVVGAYGSMKNSTEQAKAAILYPEDAMSTLIVGEQGTGKTLLTIIWYPFFKIYEKQCIEKEQAEALEA